MNIKNALGFFVLGMLMHTTPLFAQTLSESLVLNATSTRCLWLEFMGFVVGGIGLGYLVRDASRLMSVWITERAPEMLFRPTMQNAPIPQGVRMAITSF